MHASIIIAFNLEKAMQKALNKKLLIAGIPLKIATFEQKKSTEQCLKCQQFGHATKGCKNLAICQLCSQNHPTRLHTYKICEIVGESYIHTILIYNNCNGNHAANSKKYNIIITIIKNANINPQLNLNLNLESSLSLILDSNSDSMEISKW